ncbi:hypothetical protein [Qipengyuania sp. RANM35]|uniref:hypothetical protein n=1 Tax=Qipengyuania sp. RANM35 TaxID=3068635 RepID=UPI0034DAC170
MDNWNRRESLRVLGAGGILMLAGLALPMPLRATTAARSVPNGGFRLTRLLERELFDGASLRVERSWSCRFSVAGRGMLVEGADLDCLVSAPPALGALAEMERSRKGTGPFPALLDASGRIADFASEPMVDATKVIDAALAVLSHKGAKGAELIDARRALSQLTAAAQQSLSEVPGDLFFPLEETRTLQREIEIAPGTEGRIDVETRSSADPATGLLVTSERRIMTRIGEDERLAREVWRLSRL